MPGIHRHFLQRKQALVANDSPPASGESARPPAGRVEKL
jgi:hypothetical protein